MIFTAVLPAQSAAGATSTTIAGVFQALPYATDTIRAITVTSPTAVTGANTNTFTLTVRQLRAGSVVNTLASQQFTSGVNLAAEVPLSLTIATQPNMAAGDVVDVQLTQQGTGLAVPAGVQVAVAVG